MVNFIHIILLVMDIDIIHGKRANKARKLVKELIEEGGEKDDKNNQSDVNTK